MKAIDCQFLEIINGSKQFVVPVFQRDYTWTKQEWAQLWNDVLRASESGPTSRHFFGSIVYIGEEPDAVFNTYQVIDGQQRLATVLLLLTALRDHIMQSGWEGGPDSPTADKIGDYYLKNRHEPARRTHKLRLRRHDDRTLQRLIDGTPANENSAPGVPPAVRDAYDYFREKLDGTDPDAVYRGLGRLQVVNVSLKRSVDDPQLIFESLNSTGVALSQSDLVRNYLLMGLTEADQSRLYENYWRKIEADFRRANLSPDRFLREYVALKSDARKALRDHDTYDGFKHYWRPASETMIEPTRLAHRASAGAPRPSRGLSLEELLKDLRRFAEHYLAVVAPATFSDRLSPRLVRALSHVRAAGIVHALLGMQLHDFHHRGPLPEDEYVHALSLIESYIVRRSVLGWSSRNHWAVFAAIARRLRHDTGSAGDTGPVRPLETLRVAFARQARRQRFPADDEFGPALQKIDLYRRANCSRILGRLENHDQKEPSPVGEYSVEHVMPNKIGREWKEMLGDDWERIHQAWLHRLGNLTLTAYNSEMSNKPFGEKKQAPGGFNHSAVRLNLYIKDQEAWAERQMKERGQRLACLALRVWPGHGANEKALRQATIADLRGRAAARNWNDLKMGKKTGRLIKDLIDRTNRLGDVIEIAETDSTICFYRQPEFFLEVRAMKGWMRILLPLDFDDLGELPGSLTVADASRQAFFVGAVHKECGVVLQVHDAEQVEAAMPIVRRAFETVVA